MLSRLMVRTSNRCVNIPVRAFRPGTMNPYKHNPTPLTETEQDSQKNLPVWDRVFDH